MKTKSLLLLVALVLLIAPAGCIFSPDDGGGDIPPKPKPTLPFAGSENQLMENFRTVYETMDYNGYRDMLHPDYIFLLQDRTQELYPDVGKTFDRAEDLRLTERMFSGQPQVDPLGNDVPGISTISIDRLLQIGNWATSPPDDTNFPNARFGKFDVDFSFDRPGFSTLKVSGEIIFYVVGRDSVYQGTNQTYYQLIGQRDQTVDGK